MHFVDGDRQFKPIFLAAGREPIAILPLMVVETGDHGAGARAELGAEGVGVGFERENIAAGADDFVFVDGAFVQLGDKHFPDSRGAAGAHGMDTAVPAVEVADNADTFCAGSPYRKMNAANAFESDDMGTEFFISVVVAAFTHQVKIKLAQNNWEGIRIEYFKGIARVHTSLNLVTAWGGWSGLVRRPGGFKESFGAKFRGIGDFRWGKRGAFDGGRF